MKHRYSTASVVNANSKDLETCHTWILIVNERVGLEYKTRKKNEVYNKAFWRRIASIGHQYFLV